jgi:5-methylcytosine-specific restriction enzyme A
MSYTINYGRTDFHKEMLTIFRRTKEECGYDATRFPQMVANKGGLNTANKLLATNEPSDGFTGLRRYKRLGITVENLIHNSIFQVFFSAEENATAMNSLMYAVINQHQNTENYPLFIF